MQMITGYDRKVVRSGNNKDYPKKGDVVTITYTGNLYERSMGAQNDFRGKQFDTSDGRGDFKTPIGVGKVIRGWDDGVLQMSLGEKSILTISPEYAYGERGFYELIPPHAALVFEVYLKAINDKHV